MQKISVPSPQPSNLPSFNFSSTQNHTRKIPFNPEWRDVTGSVLSSLLLQQIIFRWENNGRKPFYKFKLPCDHVLYREGDSWCEEMRFTRDEFDTAMKAIAFKRTGETRDMKNTTMPVEYWTDKNRVSYFTVIEENAKLFLESFHSGNSSVNEGAQAKSGNPTLPVNPISNFTSIDKEDLHKKTDERKAAPKAEAQAVVAPKPPSSVSFFNDSLNALMNAVPKKHQTEITESKIIRSLNRGDSVDFIQAAIEYTNRKPRGRYDSYLGLVLDHPEWVEEHQQRTKEKRKRIEQIRKETVQKENAKAEEKARLEAKIQKVNTLLESVDLDALDTFIEEHKFDEINDIERSRFNKGKRLIVRERYVAEFVEQMPEPESSPEPISCEQPIKSTHEVDKDPVLTAEHEVNPLTEQVPVHEHDEVDSPEQMTPQDKHILSQANDRLKRLSQRGKDKLQQLSIKDFTGSLSFEGGEAFVH